MNYVDWSCRMLPKLNTELLDAKQAADAIKEISVRFGFSHLAMVAEYDCVQESVPLFLLRANSSFQKLRAELGKTVSIKPFYRAILLPGLYETADLDRLLLPHTKLLPICFPIGTYQDWMDLEINRLLYKKKYRLLFTSFELAILFFSIEQIHKLMRISGAVFQFNYKALTDPAVCQIIKLLLDQDATVLLGSSLTSPEKAYFYDLDFYLQEVQKLLPSRSYRKLLAQNQAFWNA